LSNNEVFMFETLANVEHNIHNIFIIGNAFGYSAVILSLLFPNAKVVCIDAGIDGADNMLGINLTNTIAKSHNLNISVEFGFSPKDTKTIIQKHFNTPLNLVFIDGLHTNEQLLLDFEETQKYCNQDTIWVMHDVINYHMQDSFEKIKKTLANTHITKLLYRTQSGIGFAAPAHNHNVLNVLEAFSENDALIAHLSQIAKGYQDPLRIIKKLIPRPIKTFIKAYLR
ncbi:class I SAM-dependent methyltransferase, partial [Helicobacter japonicus]|uniref:class I SAM-dependent methyltransferase n=1 Tax=Helicobacter japonicus TaxID=425400 RepID=UPI002630F9CF